MGNCFTTTQCVKCTSTPIAMTPTQITIAPALTMDDLTVLAECDKSTPMFSLSGQVEDAKIVDVYDGDTIRAVIILHGKPVQFIVRMLGYDSPEIKPRLNIKNREDEIKNAKIAKHVISEKILNKIVKLHCGKWDKYGRLLGVVFVDELNVNEYMIENNYGYPYTGGTKQVN